MQSTDWDTHVDRSGHAAEAEALAAWDAGRADAEAGEDPSSDFPPYLEGYAFGAGVSPDAGAAYRLAA